jgi:REP element-mobilizing transposase RayT
MSQRKRIHVDGGTYYVVQHGSVQQPVFGVPDDYAEFARILASTIPQTRTILHAYACLPLSMHLVVQIDRIPIGRFMQRLTSRYGRAAHRRTRETGHFFRQRYRAVLIEPERYLPRLVRYVHGIALPGSSSREAYAGAVKAHWLTTRTTLNLLGGVSAIESTEELALPAPPADIESFARAPMLAVLGSSEFLATLPRAARLYRTRASFEDIVHTVTSRLGVDVAQVISSSRRRDLTLARAVIAWYATERGVATLSEVARRLGRDPSTLSSAISRYRLRRPELFRLTTLHDIASLAPISVEPVQCTAAATPTRGDVAPR